MGATGGSRGSLRGYICYTIIDYLWESMVALDVSLGFLQQLRNWGIHIAEFSDYSIKLQYVLTNFVGFLALIKSFTKALVALKISSSSLNVQT